MREIDKMLDTKEDAEEEPLEDSEMDDDDEDEGDVNDTTLDSSQISRLESSEQDNIVALSDGTQVEA